MSVLPLRQSSQGPARAGALLGRSVWVGVTATGIDPALPTPGRAGQVDLLSTVQWQARVQAALEQGTLVRPLGGLWLWLLTLLPLLGMLLWLRLLLSSICSRFLQRRAGDSRMACADRLYLLELHSLVAHV